ncbi:MAG TPA: UDP-N-acetylmuramoyl-tripeptide--D-alanyl-D-alanine ligase [Ruminiclostridium sp.]|nr:UDP-N-acetylmuramoyl-tripeptide--D-alanyl-D-alanine ligase [Ruminiclostridium sp.]
MEKISLGFILNATGGRLGRECFNIKISSITTDTRKITPGSLFIALKGENFDGHDFIQAAFQKGAYAAVSEKPIENAARPVIIVKDTHTALLHLAQSYRMLFSVPVIGVTGSVGKTSTKDTIYSVLSQKYKTHKNEGNLNNEIGMPMTVFGLDKSYGASIFEMGMSGFGEISRLSRVAKPDISVITNIGISHIGKLGSRENILKAKLEIIDGMKSNGELVLNGDDDLLSGFISEAKGKLPIDISVYGINNRSGIFANNIKIAASGSEFDINFPGGIVHAYMPVPGEHNIYNALAAFCVGMKLKVDPRSIAAGLASYRPTGMRQKIEKIAGVTFIEDCYNASPDSMKAAFNVLRAVKSGRCAAVLADMLELGEQSHDAHFNVGRAAAQADVDLLLCYGKDAKYICDGYDSAGGGGKSCFFEDKKDLNQAILDLLKSGDTVIFKGSRGMKLEETVKAVYEGWKNK